MTPGITGRPGKWPWKYHSLAVTPLMPTIRLASWSYSTIRSTSRNGQRCGINASISRVVWMVSVTGSSRAGRVQCGGAGQRHASRCVQVCTPGQVRAFRPGAGSRRRSKERLAADAVEQVRGHPAGEERLVRQHRLVDRDVRHEAFDDDLIERDA